MQLCRLRVAAPAERGGLAGALRVLADHHVATVSVDAQLEDGSPIAHDLVVALRRPMDLPHLAAVLDGRGIEVVHLRAMASDGVVDPVVAALGWARGPGPTEPVEQWITAGACGLVQADAAWLANGSHPSIAGVAAVALCAGTTQHAREVVARLGPTASWLVALPILIDDGPRALVIARSCGPFSATEIARLEALTSLATVTRSPGRPLADPTLTDGAGVTVGARDHRSGPRAPACTAGARPPRCTAGPSRPLPP